MTNRDKFLTRFIISFYEKGRKTPTENNQAYWITKTINDTFKNHFGKNLLFTEKEILRAFERNGYFISIFSEEDFTWEKFHANHITINNRNFINIKVQCNKDMSNTWKQHKSNYKLETINKIDNLKESLFKFWDEYKFLIE